MENLKNYQNLDYQTIYKNGAMPDMIDVCNKLSELVKEFNNLQSALYSMEAKMTKMDAAYTLITNSLTDRIYKLEEKERLLENLRK